MPRAAKRAKTEMGGGKENWDEEGGGELKGWHRCGGLFWKNLGAVVGRPKIAGFDMDGTLINTKSGRVFPTGRMDWKFFGADSVLRESEEASGGGGGIVGKKLRSFHDDGYKVVIFTNQKGISLGSAKFEDIAGKIEDMQEILGVPIQVFIFTEDDIYRKPLASSWDFASTECNDGVEVDKSLSLYVGDAAGRPGAGKGRKGDHTDSDLKFALNVGVKFQTPEGFFFGNSDATVPKSFDFDPRHIGTNSSAVSFTKPDGHPDVEVVVLVGPPGSGKSTLCRQFFPDYNHINQDTLKKKEKCFAACAASLAEGKSCIIDNQNKEASTRENYIDLAKKHGAGLRCFYMEVPKELCFHLNAYRMLNPRIAEHRKQKVPAMVIHTFYKYREVPSEGEGFASVVSITLETFQAGPFSVEEDEKLFRSFLI